MALKPGVCGLSVGAGAWAGSTGFPVLSAQQFFQEDGDAVVVIAGEDLAGNGASARDGVRGGGACSGPQEHRQVGELIADGRDLATVDAAVRAPPRETGALADADGSEVDHLRVIV